MDDYKSSVIHFLEGMEQENQEERLKELESVLKWLIKAVDANKIEPCPIVLEHALQDAKKALYGK